MGHSNKHSDGGVSEQLAMPLKLGQHSNKHSDGGVSELTGYRGRYVNHSNKHSDGGVSELRILAVLWGLVF